jgi:hypothetical protein
MKHGPKALIGSVTPYTLQSATGIVRIILHRHSNATKSPFNSSRERVRYGDLAWSKHEMTDISSATISNVSISSEYIGG